MFTLVVFYETQATPTLALVAGLADPHVRVAADDIYVPDALPFLLAYMVVGDVYITQARIESPSLRSLANIDVCPLNLALEPSSPPLLVDIHSVPKALAGREGLNLRVSGSQAVRTFGLIWLGDGPIVPVTGEVFTVKAKSATTLVAYTWTNGAITFEQTLPTGRYQVVGMRAKSAGLVAARLVFSGGAWRPGCVGCDAYSDVPNDVFRAGNLGVWGEFNHDLPPTVDFLSVSADTSEEIWLDLIKIA